MKFYAFIITALLLSGCAQKSVEFLYCKDDGAYVNSAIESITDEGDTLAAIQKMEENLARMSNLGCTPMPGFYAHLGLLYSKIGDTKKANAYFDKEAEVFLESVRFRNFMKSDHDTQKAIVSGKYDANSLKEIK